MADDRVRGLEPSCHSARSCCSSEDAGRTAHARARSSTRRAARAGPPQSFPAADEDYFHDMDGGRRADAATRSRAATPGSSGPAATTASGTRSAATQLRHARSPEDALSHPELEVQPRQPLELPRPGQRALLREGDRPRSRALRPVARQARAPTARPIRSRTSRSIPAWRIGARGKNLPVGSFYGYADRHRRPAPVPESRLRRGGGQEVGRGALLQRSRATTTPRTWCGRIASACRAASATSARTRSSRPPIRRTRSGRT